MEGVSNAVITTSVRTLLDTIGDVPDLIPGHVLEAHGLMTRREALERIHRPRDLAEWAAALKRIKWDEAFVLQVELGRRRAEARAQPAQARSGTTDGLAAAFDRQLPFQLTEGQETVGGRISAELASPHPMNRLLQGEVGTGKTVVALRAMLTVVDSGGQAALLAPTEVLAQQHHRSITAMLGPLAQADELGGAEVATRVALLTGSQSAATRRAALDECSEEEPASSSGRTHCCSRPSSSTISGWSSSTSSTASGSSNVIVCATRLGKVEHLTCS